jgi:DNA-binding transcriptional ArsR family regulator
LSKIASYLRPRREKVFGDGYTVPLDRNAKVRIWHRAKALSRKTEKGKHYGALTAKALDVLHALLWTFHNAKSGLCFPSYERIAEAAKCARSTVAEHLKALEDAGLLTWVNRIVRIREPERDLFGHWVNRWRVIRTSNTYTFHDHGEGPIKGLASKSEFRSGTTIQELSLSPNPPPRSNSTPTTHSTVPYLPSEPPSGRLKRPRKYRGARQTARNHIAPRFAGPSARPNTAVVSGAINLKHGWGKWERTAQTSKRNGCLKHSRVSAQHASI